MVPWSRRADGTRVQLANRGSAVPYFKFLPPDGTVRHVMMNQPQR
jgi:hypothetical protein